MVSAVRAVERFCNGDAGFGHFLFAERGAFGFGNNILRIFNGGAASVVAARRAGVNGVILVGTQNNSANFAEALVSVFVFARVGYCKGKGVNGVFEVAVKTNRANCPVENFHAVRVVIVRVNVHRVEKLRHNVNAGVPVANFQRLAVDNNFLFRAVDNGNGAFVGVEQDVFVKAAGGGNLRDNVCVAGVGVNRVVANARRQRSAANASVSQVDNVIARASVDELVVRVDENCIVAGACNDRRAVACCRNVIVAVAHINDSVSGVEVNCVVAVAGENFRAVANVVNFVIAAARVYRHVIAVVFDDVIHIAGRNFGAVDGVKNIVDEINIVRAGVGNGERAVRAADNEVGAGSLDGWNFFDSDLGRIFEAGNCVAAAAENNRRAAGVVQRNEVVAGASVNRIAGVAGNQNRVVAVAAVKLGAGVAAGND